MQAQHADLPIAEDLDVLDLVGDVAPTPDLAERLEEAGQDAKLSFEVQLNGRLKLNVDRLGALGEGESLKWLRKTTSKNAPEDRLTAGPAVRVRLLDRIPAAVTAPLRPSLTRNYTQGGSAGNE
ncbi:hypothetical protein [Streptomyces europaeiscabiei]|uniref:hypothetical protein n=1 Tax=Streptomyces europaeiscabiei TaxID=146819 RepID=UPI0013C45944|nr:hypothetical protein [Streptomyces europaeiscabiei]MDX3833220.1 hypothetical protein [Streptomyces europaeiscabiei]